MKPGAKYYEWELRGVPLRLEIGPRDLATNQAMLVRARHAREAAAARWTGCRRRSPTMLDAMQDDMLAAALARREAEQHPRRTAYDAVHGADGRAGRRSSTPAGAATRRCEARDQGGDQGDDPRACPTRSSARPRRRRPAWSCGEPAKHEVVWAQGVLTHAAFARRRRRRCIVRGRCPLDAHRRRRRHAGLRVQRGDDPRARYRALDAALAGVPHRIHYAVKANCNLRVLRAAARAGRRRRHRVRRRAVSRAARRLRGRRTSSSAAWARRSARLARGARGAACCCINVESRRGARALVDRGGARAGRSRARRHPGESRRHASTRRTPTSRPARRGTSSASRRPGAARWRALRAGAAAPRARRRSTCTSAPSSSTLEPYRGGVGAAARAGRRRCAAAGVDTLEYLDIGGGLGVPLRRRGGARPRRASRGDRAAACEHAGLDAASWSRGGSWWAEPGVLLTRVLYRKHSGGKDFVIVDAGMNDLVRPGALQGVPRDRGGASRARRRVDRRTWSGPVCETGDFLALDRELPTCSRATCSPCSAPAPTAS